MYVKNNIYEAFEIYSCAIIPTEYVDRSKELINPKRKPLNYKLIKTIHKAQSFNNKKIYIFRKSIKLRQKLKIVFNVTIKIWEKDR